MRKFLINVFLALLFLVMVVFLVANRQSVFISFDPISVENPALAIGPMPMWSAMALTLFIGSGLGAIGMWASNGSLRRRAKERKREIRRLEAELKMARANDPEPPQKGTNLPARRRA